MRAYWEGFRQWPNFGLELIEFEQRSQTRRMRGHEVEVNMGVEYIWEAKK